MDAPGVEPGYAVGPRAAFDGGETYSRPRCPVEAEPAPEAGQRAGRNAPPCRINFSRPLPVESLTAPRRRSLLRSSPRNDRAPFGGKSRTGPGPTEAGGTGRGALHSGGKSRPGATRGGSLTGRGGSTSRGPCLRRAGSSGCEAGRRRHRGGSPRHERSGLVTLAPRRKEESRGASAVSATSGAAVARHDVGTGRRQRRGYGSRSLCAVLPDLLAASRRDMRVARGRSEEGPEGRT